jgi:ubiquinone/menaquinone biosynthesis C-methylase UbiE
METNSNQGLHWQIGVWDRMSEIYLREVDRRFAPVVEQMLARAALKRGERILDLGTGTGAVTFQAAPLVGSDGRLTGIDISPDMLRIAQRRAAELGLKNAEFREGSAELIPAENASFDVVLACLSLMYVIDRAAAARQIARVLRPGGRLVAAVWAAPGECDIVLFQQTAGSFAPPPPVAGVGPGALADPGEFLHQLSQAGIRAEVERQQFEFDFEDFDSAWEVLAGVTTAQLAPERRQEAKNAVRARMWPHSSSPRHFRNMTQFIIGRA